MDLKKRLASEIDAQKNEIKKILGGKTFIKRAELEKIRTEAYAQEQEELERSRAEKLDNKLKAIKKFPADKNGKQENSEIVHERKHLDPLPSEAGTVTNTLPDESKAIEKAETSTESAAKIESSTRKHSISDKEDEPEIHKRIKEAQIKGTNAMETDPINPALVKTEPFKTRAIIIVFFTRLLNEWEQDLERTSEEVKMTRAGKSAIETLNQTREFLKPLFTLLREPKGLADDVAQSIGEICHYMQHKDYVRASDAYLRLAIGNSPWPIGVIGVGLNDRTKRDMVGANKVAHVLNDEITRKWVQSIKRILSFCEKAYPPRSTTI